jgi:hypothetical protein
VYFTDSSTGTVVGQRVILKTTDAGTTWITVLNHTLEVLEGVSFNNSEIGIVVGMDGTILRSSNGGYTWTTQPSGTPANLYSVFCIDENTVTIVGSGGTILNNTKGGVTFVQESPIFRKPAEYFLSYNYPNPFNPNTKIIYSVPQISNVSIKIYDVLGTEIETLVNETKAAGTYELTWNAGNLPSGVYFYRLEAGEVNQIKKMILLR